MTQSKVSAETDHTRIAGTDRCSCGAEFRSAADVETHVRNIQLARRDK
jgi:hypothetical protein